MVYAVVMPHTRSFSRLAPSIVAVVFIGLSMYCLSLAMRSLPVSTAYATWVGIGASGTALVGMLFLGESRDLGHIGGILLIISGIIILKLSHK